MTSRIRHLLALSITAVVLLLSVGCTTVQTLNPPGDTAPSVEVSTSRTGPPQDRSIPDVVSAVGPSVVTITTAGGVGSGVIYRTDGVIVTDAHVVEDPGTSEPYAEVQVQLADGTMTVATVVAVDDTTDVAVIRTDRAGLPAARFATATPRVGDVAVVIGTALGMEGTVTSGIVSGLHRNMPPTQEQPEGSIDLLQTDAAISPGNSGGAVANATGEIIGLTEAYFPPSSGAVSVGFVTPSTTVIDVVEQLLEDGTASHASLGVVPVDLTPELIQRFSLSAALGALLTDVSLNGPADTAGLRAGDLLTSFAGEEVGSATDLLAELRRAEPGQRVEVVIRRGSEAQTVTVELSDLDRDEG